MKEATNKFLNEFKENTNKKLKDIVNRRCESEIHKRNINTDKIHIEILKIKL